jgi:hypothetical protein
LIIRTLAERLEMTDAEIMYSSSIFLVVRRVLDGGSMNAGYEIWKRGKYTRDVLSTQCTHLSNKHLICNLQSTEPSDNSHPEHNKTVIHQPHPQDMKEMIETESAGKAGSIYPLYPNGYTNIEGYGCYC